MPENNFLKALTASTKNSEECKLIWRDEFKNESSWKKWNLQDWPSDKNEELQYYSPKISR